MSNFLKKDSMKPVEVIEIETKYFVASFNNFIVLVINVSS